MANYYLTNKAVDDLTNIWNYTYEKWSEQQADKYYQMLIEHCEKIAKDFKIGKNYCEISNELFGYRSMRHIVFYRIISDNLVEITRILHVRMDLKKRILE